MNTEIYYFSGTGNSLAVARDIAEKTNGKLISILAAINKKSIKTEADSIGIVFPAYMAHLYGVPLIVERFIKKLEDTNLKYYELMPLTDKSIYTDERCNGCAICATFGVGRCVCTGINATKVPVSITYCHCCKGHLMKLLEAALEKPLRGEVLTSCISGSDDCRFAIHLD